MSAHSANTAVLIPISFERFSLRLDRHGDFVGNEFREWQKEALWRDYMAGSRRKPDIEGLSKSPPQACPPNKFSSQQKKKELKWTRMLTSGSSPAGPHENREHRPLPRNRG